MTIRQVSLFVSFERDSLNEQSWGGKKEEEERKGERIVGVKKSGAPIM